MEAMNDKRRWYVVVSKPFSEKKAVFNLVNQGFETYLPFAVTQRPARKGKVNETPLIRPLFARHIFVRLELDRDAWRKIFSTLGVSSMLLAGERPLEVRQHYIDDMRAREDVELAALLPKAGPQGKNPVIAVEPATVDEPAPRLSEEAIGELKAGAPIRVAHLGSEWDAVFREPVDTKRVSVVVQLLGREVDLEITHAQII